MYYTTSVFSVAARVSLFTLLLAVQPPQQISAAPLFGGVLGALAPLGRLGIQGAAQGIDDAARLGSAAAASGAVAVGSVMDDTARLAAAAAAHTSGAVDDVFGATARQASGIGSVIKQAVGSTATASGSNPLANYAFYEAPRVGLQASLTNSQNFANGAASGVRSAVSSGGGSLGRIAGETPETIALARDFSRLSISSAGDDILSGGSRAAAAASVQSPDAVRRAAAQGASNFGFSWGDEAASHVAASSLGRQPALPPITGQLQNAFYPSVLSRGASLVDDTLGLAAAGARPAAAAARAGGAVPKQAVAPLAGAPSGAAAAVGSNGASVAGQAAAVAGAPAGNLGVSSTISASRAALIAASGAGEAAVRNARSIGTMMRTFGTAITTKRGQFLLFGIGGTGIMSGMTIGIQTVLFDQFNAVLINNSDTARREAEAALAQVQGMALGLNVSKQEAEESRNMVALTTGQMWKMSQIMTMINMSRQETDYAINKVYEALMGREPTTVINTKVPPSFVPGSSTKLKHWLPFIVGGKHLMLISFIGPDGIERAVTISTTSGNVHSYAEDQEDTEKVALNPYNVAQPQDGTPFRGTQHDVFSHLPPPSQGQIFPEERAQFPPNEGDRQKHPLMITHETTPNPNRELVPVTPGQIVPAGRPRGRSLEDMKRGGNEAPWDSVNRRKKRQTSDDEDDEEEETTSGFRLLDRMNENTGQVQPCCYRCQDNRYPHIKRLTLPPSYYGITTTPTPTLRSRSASFSSLSAAAAAAAAARARASEDDNVDLYATRAPCSTDCCKYETSGYFYIGTTTTPSGKTVTTPSTTTATATTSAARRSLRRRRRSAANSRSNVLDRHPIAITSVIPFQLANKDLLLIMLKPEGHVKRGLVVELDAVARPGGVLDITASLPRHFVSVNNDTRGRRAANVEESSSSSSSSSFSSSSLSIFSRAKSFFGWFRPDNREAGGNNEEGTISKEDLLMGISNVNISRFLINETIARLLQLEDSNSSGSRIKREETEVAYKATTSHLLAKFPQSRFIKVVVRRVKKRGKQEEEEEEEEEEDVLAVCVIPKSDTEGGPVIKCSPYTLAFRASIV